MGNVHPFVHPFVHLQGKHSNVYKNRGTNRGSSPLGDKVHFWWPLKRISAIIIGITQAKPHFPLIYGSNLHNLTISSCNICWRVKLQSHEQEKSDPIFFHPFITMKKIGKRERTIPISKIGRKDWKKSDRREKNGLCEQSLTLTKFDFQTTLKKN
jgi:hypothetical protein